MDDANVDLITLLSGCNSFVFVHSDKLLEALKLKLKGGSYL